MTVIFMILVLKDYKASVTHWYVLNLAIADSSFLLTLPFKIQEDINGRWIYSEWSCKAANTILFINYYASVLFLMIMSIDRYIALCHPYSDNLQKLRKRSSSFIITIIIWVASILLCIPIMMYSNKSGISPDCRCSYQFQSPELLCKRYDDPMLTEVCLDHFNNANNSENGELFCRSGEYLLNDIFDYGSENSESGSSEGGSSESGSAEIGSTMLYGNYSEFRDPDSHLEECSYKDEAPGWIALMIFNVTAMFLLPLIVMLFSYGLIIARLSGTRMNSADTCTTSKFIQSESKAGSRKSSKSRQSQSDKSRRRVTAMCAALVSCFVICWLPFHSAHLANVVGFSATKGTCSILSTIGSLLAFCNSALNPFLYNFLGTRFKRRWRNVTSTIRRSVKRRQSSSSVIGSVRFTKRKQHREGSTSNTGIVMTKIYRKSSRLSSNRSDVCTQVNANQRLESSSESFTSSHQNNLTHYHFNDVVTT